MNQATYLLTRKIKEMCDMEAEMEFYVLESLFTDDVDVPEVVKTFQVVYDDAFYFEGSAKNLYEKIDNWIDENVD